MVGHIGHRAAVRLTVGWAVALLALGATAVLTATAASPAVRGVRTTIATTPVRLAHTTDGTVAYRLIGHGSPLVLITGFSASIDSWAPSFVDQLAAHHRVVVFNNAGVGQTSAVTPPLSITAMANQTSALITSLKLGRTAVLGWSMGGMIAQALAVEHPSQVSHLVLAATQAGNGRALPIPTAAAADAASANPADVLSILFPAGQSAALGAYVRGILSYPGFYNAPAAVKVLQTEAISTWMAGDVPAGRQVAKSRIPTLVADGTEDQLDPVANDHQLAGLIKGAQLALYPDAGHGFLFQDSPAFVARVEKFLGF